MPEAAATDSTATAAAADSAAILAAADSAALDSLINRQAMAHLQPSSFSDLIALLPGFVSKDPQMGEANLIALRQAPQATSGDNYSTSSLGTSFLIDGVPINTSSQLQTTSDSSRSARLTAGKGVDMRAISTDDKLSFTPETIIQMVSRPTNASLIDKKGVEFTFSSRRIPMIRTRVTVNGAWFHTRLTNSDGLWYKPSTIVNGKELYYAGYYDDPDGSVYQSINTNFTFDTDVPRLGLNVSLTVQNMWFTSTRQLPRSGMPTQYIGIDGEIHPWTGADAENPYLQQLIRRYSSTAFDVRAVPVATQFNIKATKRFWRDRIGLALYVNRLISITPDYMQYGIVQRRYSSPYFGMEMNLKI